MKDKITIPGTLGKRNSIEMLVESMGAGEPNYLAYTASVVELTASIAQQSVTGFSKLMNNYLLHWAAGHPYQEMLAKLDLSIPIDYRIAVVESILQTVQKHSSSELFYWIQKSNAWGETVAHVAVASQNISDADSLSLLTALLSYLPERLQQDVLRTRNHGRLSVLDYAKLLDKTETAAYIESLLTKGQKPAQVLSQGFGHFVAAKSVDSINYLSIRAGREYQQTITNYSHQVFAMKPEDINAVLRTNEDAVKLGKTHLTKREAWLGLKWKAEAPVNYIPVIESAIVEGSRQSTKYGETFTRVMIRPNFITGTQIFVKEEIHVYEAEKRIMFLGCPVDIDEAKHYLKKAKEFNVEENMLSEKPLLFNVEHAVSGAEVMPIATWRMVRVSGSTDDSVDEAQHSLHLGAFIDRMKGTNTYLQTIRQLLEATATLDFSAESDKPSTEHRFTRYL